MSVRLSVVVMLSLLTATSLAKSQEETQAEKQDREPLAIAPPSAVIAARVNGAAISMAEVEREVQRVVDKRSVATEDRPRLLAATLSKLVDRALVREYLIEKKFAAKPAEVDLEIERAQNQLAQQKIPLEDHLAQLGVSREQFRRELDWQIGWGRYLERNHTDENLKRYFEKHRPHFDGGRRRVAHILFKIAADASGDSERAAIAAANDVRAEIESKKSSFADAARRHSSAPTAEVGGDIGFISRHDPMPEAFSRAAFDLAVGQTSAPVVTAFGVHLIECRETERGKRTWEEAREELRPALAVYLFDWIAEKRRPAAKIEFTGEAPHFKPGTRELVE